MTDVEFVTANGIQMAVYVRYVSGPETAPAMLMLHGLGELAVGWEIVRPELERHYRVIAPDLRGHGQTDWPGTYSLKLMRDDTVLLMNELALDRVILVGHSMGAGVAYLIAEDHCQRVDRLIVEDAPPPYPRVGPPIPDRPEGVDLPFDWEMLLAIRGEVDDPDLDAWANLPRITARTLMVAGGPTSPVSQEKIHEAVALVRQATLVTIPAGHHVHTNEPNEFVATVLEWLGS
ncbi:MAG TPA: alpha/beta hydrolase [Acidimicrobiales bacterium]|nr:alpha/beta hydrolase [Acidimicrobiales bacterium]